MQQAPVAGAILGDLGADVIKIEPPTGDSARGLSTVLGTHPALPGGRHALFEAWNRNKRGIALNLERPRAREIVYRLVKQSDVFLTNYRSQRAMQFGLDYETLRKQNPRIIYAFASGFGSRGPDREMPSYDLVAAARSGVMTGCGQPDQGEVVPLVGGYVDQCGGVMLAFGVVAALLARERLGIGQKIDASLLGTQLHLQYSSLTELLLTGMPYQKRGRNEATNPVYSWYRCRDGAYIMVGLLTPDQYWSRFCQALGLTHIEKDPRFADMGSREIHNVELIKILDALFITRTCREWEDLFREADLPASKVTTLPEAAGDPQVLANDYVVDFAHPEMGNIKMPGFPIQFSETPSSIRMPAPNFAQHNEEVLIERCGYTWEDIESLREEGAICA